jgi:hypothetical protein
MIKHLKRVCGWAVGIGLGSALLVSAHGEELANRFDVHGFGYQTYAQTNANTYNGADGKGSWDDNFLGLAASVTLSDKSKLWTQLEASGMDTTHFTWFFVDYQFTDRLRARVGRINLPMGLYNDFIDNKQLQVSELEPSLYQSAAHMVFDAYNGVGIDFDHRLGAGHLNWQVYGGNIVDDLADVADFNNAVNIATLTDTKPPTNILRNRGTAGGRVTYLSPVEGLKFMISANYVLAEKLSDRSTYDEHREIASLSYATDAYDIKAEYGNHSLMGVTSRVGYIQVGNIMIGKVMLYARYDNVVTDYDNRSDPSYYQKTVLLGLGYKLGPNVSVKVENHFNHGYALPVASGEVAARKGLDRWSMFAAGINFAF